jgi:hypothetical protein
MYSNTFIMTTEKKCKGCLEVKPLTDFYKYRPDSYRGKCKDCFQNNIKSLDMLAFFITSC